MSPALKYAVVLFIIGLNLLAASLNLIALLAGDGDAWNAAAIVLNLAIAYYFARPLDE